MMKALGTDIGTIHFVGIGGIGMSGIAEVMHQLGYKVQGSDVAEGYVVEKLRKPGIPVAIGHSRRQSRRCGGRGLLDRDQGRQSRGRRGGRAPPAAGQPRRNAGRADAHAEDRRGRRHARQDDDDLDGRGAARRGGLDPTVINGGIINRYGSNARLGKSDWWVIEADESDGSFLRLDGTIAVVTNIDPEHLEHYGSFDAVKDAFVEFIENVPFYGARGAVRRSSRGAERSSAAIRDRRIVTYGFSALADVRADNVTPIPGGSRFDAVILDRDGERADDRRRRRCRCPAGTMSRMRWPRSRVALELGFATRPFCQGFERFDGVKRRFTKVGEVDGAIIIDDYAHHPIEIRAVLAAAREGGARGG